MRSWPRTKTNYTDSIGVLNAFSFLSLRLNRPSLKLGYKHKNGHFVLWSRSSHTWMRSSLVFWQSNANVVTILGSNLSILRQIGIWGSDDEAVLNTVLNTVHKTGHFGCTGTYRTNCRNQCFGSGLDPDSIRSVDPDPGCQQWPTKLEKTSEISCFEVLGGRSLLRAEVFSCSLDILYRGLEKVNCKFWLLKYQFFFTCKFFSILVIKTLDRYPGPDRYTA